MKKKYVYLIALLTGFSFFLLSCSEDPTPSLFEQIKPAGEAAVISSVSPSDVALAGVSEITITGQNFSTTAENNFVYFNDTRANVIEASATQLKVTAPAVTIPIDSVNGVEYTVKIWVYDLEKEIDKYSNSYVLTLRNAVSEAFEFSDNQKPYGFTVDASSNIFVSLEAVASAGIGGVKKITPDRELFDFGNRGSETFYADLKMGTGGYVYALLNASSGTGAIFRFNPAGGAPERYKVGAPLRKLNDLDFDAAGNLWTAGDGGNIFSVSSTDQTITSYPFAEIVSGLKIYDNYLYVAARGSSDEKVYRFPLNADGTLGSQEEYFNFSNAFGFDVAEITALTISADGEIVLGTNLPDAIVVIKTDKSYFSLYPGLISSPVYSMEWGPDNYLYYTRAQSGVVDTPEYLKQTIIKIDMQKLGAQYYGRN